MTSIVALLPSVAVLTVTGAFCLPDGNTLICPLIEALRLPCPPRYLVTVTLRCLAPENSPRPLGVTKTEELPNGEKSAPMKRVFPPMSTDNLASTLSDTTIPRVMTY